MPKSLLEENNSNELHGIASRCEFGAIHNNISYPLLPPLRSSSSIYLYFVSLGCPEYEVVCNAGGLKVPWHADRQRVAASLRGAASYQERAHLLAA